MKTTEHIAIVGAGIGGLGAAIRLAAAGKRVSLFDKSDGPGGKMRTVDSPAGPVDAGPTVLTMRQRFDDLFKLANTALEDHVTLTREPLLARHFWPDGSQLDLFDNRERSVDSVADFAGQREAKAFRKFSERAERLFKAFEAPMMESAVPSLSTMATTVVRQPTLFADMGYGRPLAATLASQFRDPRLRQLFGRYATYIGGTPALSPGVLQLIWHAEESGVWTVKGGMSQLANALGRLAESLSVETYHGHAVERIDVQNGRVAAITANGRRIACDSVVFNGDPRALHTGKLGHAVSKAVQDSGVAPRSLSARVWSFAATPEGPDLVHHNVFFGHNPDDEFGPITKGQPPSDPTLYICAQDRNHGTSRDTPLERFEIIENAAPSATEEPEEKDQCQTRVFSRLKDFGLTFTPQPSVSALTTPAMFNGLFPESLGSLYGLSPHGTMAAFQRPTARTAIPGLYLAGGGAHPGAGIAMAALSGAHAAAAIMSDLTSTSPSHQTAMRGGTSTASPMTGPKPSPSSPS